MSESERAWASSNDRHTGRRDLLLSERNMSKCVVATLVLSEDTCCFEYVENSLRFGWEAVDAQGCEPDDKAACRTIFWPGGPCGQIKVTYLTDCDSLSDNVTLICPHRPSAAPPRSLTSNSATETNLKFNLSLSESDRLKFELKIYL